MQTNIAEAAGAQAGRLTARPNGEVGSPRAPGGIVRLEGEGDEILLAVPSRYRPGVRAPLVVMFHGAGADASRGLRLLGTAAEEAGVFVLATTSHGGTWDLLLGDPGPDVAELDRALQAVFGSYGIDRDRIAIGGFSDGASYALSLGLANGDLFSQIIAFSPAFFAPATLVGKPQIFVSHGTTDAVLPADRCSRLIVPELEALDYAVTYREFAGGHTIPPDVQAEAVASISRR